MKNQYRIKKFLLILLVLILLIHLTGKRYRWFLPTMRFVYPNNNEEILEVIEKVKNRTMEDIHFHRLTDINIRPAFKKICPEVSDKEMNEIIFSKSKEIMFLKNIINRARPKQIYENLNILKSETAATPAFPAGHAAQAYILASYLQDKFPEKKQILEDLADKCNNCRVKAGLHYPSDGEFSKLLFYKY